MHDKKEYIVGEIFRFNEQTFQCVASDIPYIRCKKCAMPHNRCCTVICDKTRRYDLRDVHFIRVTNPENGMLFRASDGVLYELIENECIHYMDDSLCTCYEIDRQAFGDILSNKFHWYPVKENKQEKSNMEETKRRLELAVVDAKNVEITFKVVDQFYGGDEFSKQANKHEFTAKNGITICLDEKFEWDGFNRILSLRKLEEATVRLAREAAIVEVYNKCGLAGKYELTEAVREYLTALFECNDRSFVWYSKDFEKLAKKYLKTYDN